MVGWVSSVSSHLSSFRFSAKGALYAKIALTPQYCIHVFTTHLQSTYEKDVGIMDPSVVVRLNQIAMLKEFIDDCTRSKPAHEPIFLMGDMNTNGREASGSGKHSEEYNIMNKILQGEIAPSNIPSMGPTNSLSTTSNITASLSNLMSKTIRYQMHDLAYEAYGQHPVTYADVTDHSSKTPRETVLTAADDLGGCCSFDYIIWMNQAEHNAMNKDNFCTIKQNATKVDKFLIEGQPFTQISGKI